MEYEGRTALITGASGGIGEEFATQLAARGASLVLVARSASKLEELADGIRRSEDAEVTVIPLDLARAGAADELLAATTERGLTVDVLVNNAGFGVHGAFAEANPDRLSQQVQLNVGTLVGLTRLYLPGMLERRRGAIVNVASNAAFQPLPGLAVYAATKSFVLSFTRALWGELRGSGVRALALCPGPTATAFFDEMGDAPAFSRRRTVHDVVATALRALDRGKPSVVDGPLNSVVARVATRLVPERLLIRVSGRAVRG